MTCVYSYYTIVILVFFYVCIYLFICFIQYIVYIIFIYILVKVIHEVNFSITQFIVSIFFISEFCYYLDFNIKFKLYNFNYLLLLHKSKIVILLFLLL